MKYSLGISSFLEEISSLSHSFVFLYFFALITEEGFLISPCYSLELCKKPVNPQGNQSWIFFGRTDAEAKTPIWPPDVKNWLIWKGHWCWERLKEGREGADRGWDGWMALPTRWTWVWVSSRSWWWTGKPSVLQSMGWQRVGHNWMTKLNRPDLKNEGSHTKKFPTTKHTPLSPFLEKGFAESFLLIWGFYSISHPHAFRVLQ